MVFFFYLMRIKKLSAVCEEFENNYDPQCPIVHDDRTTFTKLDSYLILAFEGKFLRNG